MSDPSSNTTGPAYEIARLKAENEFMRNMINLCSGSCCTPEDWPKRLAWWKANDPKKRHTIGDIEDGFIRDNYGE